MSTKRFLDSGRWSVLKGLGPIGLVVVLTAGTVSAAEGQTGEQIYQQRCASCHGVSGEGTEDDYPHPLVGKRSLDSLTRYIDRRMPELDPEECVGEDASRVAAYLYEAFYSPLAQARNRSTRIELSRLTVRQYRNALTDLIGSFRAAGHWDEARGLRGEYFRGRELRGDQRVLDRVDPQVRFDFGESGPVPDTFEPNSFSIRWQGSVLAPETGEYEFILRTEHAARLWVNDPNQPLIDAWVKSSDDREQRATIVLLGGRAYPIRLDFTKAKQGVDDANQQMSALPNTASIVLEWKPPGRVAEVIPERVLTPNRFPETYVSQVPFPPDDRIIGYERGTSVSKEWDRATTEGAIEAADYLAAHLGELAGVPNDAPDRPARLRAFCLRFVERAFRRPLEDELSRIYLDRQFEESSDPEQAVKRVVLLTLKSPRFLYHEIGGPTPDPYEVAERLALGLWDSLPDQELINAAAAGQLAAREQVAAQAERMLPDLRTRSKLHDFFLQWLKVEHPPDLAKAPGVFTGFDQAIASDLRTSLELTLEEVAWGDASDFRQLLRDESLYLNGRLGRFYGVELPDSAPFQKVAPGQGERAGVLTHPYLMATFAYTETTSPIHRGVFLARNVLGRALRPPPNAFAPLAPDLHPDLNTRERVLLQTRAQECQACHGMINPLGFALEHYDAVGRYRDQEKDRPIDASGHYQTLAGPAVEFSGARDLANFLAGSEEVHTAFVERLFHHLIKQPLAAYGPDTLADLRRSFEEHQCQIRQLMVEILATTALAPRVSGP